MQRLTHNWSLKFVSLVLAVMLWSHVRGEVNPLETSTLDVPLRVEAPRDVILLSPNLPEKVTVLVRGPRVALRNIKGGALANPLATTDVAPNVLNGAIRAGLDFTGARKGEQHLAVKAVSNVEEVEVLGTKPAEVAVSLDRAQSVRFVVNPSFGKLDAGLKLEAVRVSPPTIEAFGPSNALARVRSVRAKISDVEAQRGAQTIVATLAALDRNGAIVSRVRLATTTAQVSFTAREVPVEKRVAVKIVPVGAAAKDFAVDSIEVEPSRVTIRALPRALKSGQPRVEFDVSGGSQTIRRRVRVPLADGIEVVPSRVRVTVKFKRLATPQAKTPVAPDEIPVRRDEP